MAPQPAEARTPTDHDWHTDDLPDTPQRDFLIPAERWVEAPAVLHVLGADFGVELVAYKRRIGRFLLWRAGPAARADARYMAIAADDFNTRYTFRLHPDGEGEGISADGQVHTRFRSWKEALRAASAREAGDSQRRSEPGPERPGAERRERKDGR